MFSRRAAPRRARRAARRLDSPLVCALGSAPPKDGSPVLALEEADRAEHPPPRDAEGGRLPMEPLPATAACTPAGTATGGVGAP